MNPGDICYFIENNLRIVKATVVKITGDFVLLKYGSGSGIRLRKSRVYISEEEAREKLDTSNQWKRKSPYDYEN